MGLRILFHKPKNYCKSYTKKFIHEFVPCIFWVLIAYPCLIQKYFSHQIMSEAEGKEKQDDIESVRCQLAQYQPALLSHWHSLDEKEGANFGQYLRNFDFAYLATSFKCALEPKLPSTEIHPIPAEQTVDRAQLGEDEKTRLTNIGLKAIAEGRVAAVVLAGGQASRLGSVRPKGVIPLGTGLCPDGTSDSLLFVQASQIVRLQSLAAERFPAEAEASGGRVTWLVMASKSTESATRDHLTAVLNETGLSPSQMLFFTQNEIPAFDFDGHAFLKDDTQLVTAPDGNGGFYDAVRPLLPELEQRGVTHVHIYCVDNILCRVADPTMVGCAIDRETDCALKAIEKRDPAEQVGHVCLQNGHVSVLEYSEISRDLAERRNAVDPAKLFLNAGSIANHLVTLDFLKDAVANKDTVLPYHVACKRIPFWDMERKTMVHPTEPNGIKLERFIFDAFSLSKKVLLWMVPAEEEFSPLKNAECVGRDCLSTCLRALHSSHGHLIREACLGIVRAGAKINC